MLLARARVLAACAAALSCTRRPPGAVAVGTLSVSDGNLARVPELAMPAELVRKEMKAALERTRHFAVREGASARVRLELESARRLAGGEGAVADVQLILELTAASPEGEPERTVSEGAGRAVSAADAGTEAHTRLAAFEGALRGALDDAARGLAWQLESRRKTDDELSRDLGDADARVRDYAIRALADRRSPAVVPQLIARLEDDNPAVALRAVGALVAIGDRRAVEPLIEITRKRPPQLVAPVLYAPPSLGGPTAGAFLYTLECSDPDDAVRHAATDALAELRRKRDEASAHDANPTRPPPTTPPRRAGGPLDAVRAPPAGAPPLQARRDSRQALRRAGRRSGRVLSARGGQFLDVRVHAGRAARNHPDRRARRAVVRR